MNLHSDDKLCFLALPIEILAHILTFIPECKHHARLARTCISLSNIFSIIRKVHFISPKILRPVSVSKYTNATNLCFVGCYPEIESLAPLDNVMILSFFPYIFNADITHKIPKNYFDEFGKWILHQPLHEYEGGRGKNIPQQLIYQIYGIPTLKKLYHTIEESELTHISPSVLYLRVSIRTRLSTITSWDRFVNLQSVRITITNNPALSSHLIKLKELPYLQKIYLIVHEVPSETITVLQELPIFLLSFRGTKTLLPDLKYLQKCKTLKYLRIDNPQTSSCQLEPLLNSNIHCSIQIGKQQVSRDEGKSTYISYKSTYIKGSINEVYEKLKTRENN